MNAAGIPVQSLNPKHIKLFGNQPGILPEVNGKDRYDDLTEIAIQVAVIQ